MSKQYEHIRWIRKEKYWLDDSIRRGEENPLLKDLQQSNKLLSDDIYRKDSHFLLELIQNAEDNLYDCYNPTLSFALVKKDPTNENTSGGALIVSNNEIGFSQDNMNAMCSIGSSFKKKLKGYIGEKGIGFKSVFKVTKSPYIFSKGYQVRFPDEVAEIELGYIVPEWVDSIPKVAEPKQTTIILPLNKDEKIGFSTVSKMMREFTPETILFLSKITQLKFSVENEYEIVISKTFDTDFVVRLTILESVEGNTTTKYQEYLLYSKNFKRPSDLRAKNREDVFDRDITISFPVGDTVTEGAVYAYLPVLENTGLPFILNADFLVPSSRDMIFEDEEWNKWLLRQIPDLFIEAFTQFIRLPKYCYELYRHIPIETKLKAVYFSSIIEPIITRLSELPIIPTVPNRKLVIPSEAIRSSDFRKSISGLKLPNLLKGRMVTEKFQNTISKDVANALGIQSLNSEDVIACLSDEAWIREIGYDGLIKVYKYLSSRRKSYPLHDLKECKILPIRNGKKIKFSCVQEQPIYFEATKQDMAALKEKPKCINAKIQFLDNDFYDLIKNDEELTKWMTEVLCVFPFSLKKYAHDIIKWFRANHNALNDEQFVVTSNYILDHSSRNLILVDFPILLSDGQRILFSNDQSQNKNFVTPAGQNPESGWQLIFSSEDDRKHFSVLSDLYLRDNEKVPKIVDFTKATRNPPLPKLTMYPFEHGWNYWKYRGDYSDIEITTLEEAFKKSADRRTREISLSRALKPSSLSSVLSEKISIALIRWLNGRCKNYYYSWDEKELMTEVAWYFHQPYTKQIESEMTIFLRNEKWLPTTKGLQKPSHAFKKKSGVYDVLGDTVPYFEHNLNEVISEFIGIRVEPSNDDLISYLSSISTSNEGSFQAAEKIYTALSLRDLTEDEKNKLISFESIAVPINDSIIWASPKICIWEDRSDLFQNEFYYLSNLYPKLKSFFIEQLDVALDIDDEKFCDLWLDIQKREVVDIKSTENKVQMLYNRLKPLFDSSDTSSDNWWKKFIPRAMLWASSKKFLKPSQIYIPDDGTLMDVFEQEQVDYLWYPKGSSYSQWESLHSVFQLKSLKKSVFVDLKYLEEESLVESKVFLTNYAKALILMWLWEKKRSLYEHLKDGGIISMLVETNEYMAEQLVVDYTLADFSIEDTIDCYIDISKGKMYYTKAAGKTTIAAEINRKLTENDIDDHFELWIKGVLGASEQDVRAELRKNNWQIPDEIRQLLNERATSAEKPDKDESTEKAQTRSQFQADLEKDAEISFGGIVGANDTEIDGVKRSSGFSSLESDQQKKWKPYSEDTAAQQSQKETTIKVQHENRYGYNEESEEQDFEREHEPVQSIEDELFSRFNTKDSPIQDDNELYYDAGSTANPIGRYEKEYDKALEKKEYNRPQRDRYREIRTRILDGPDPLVREALIRWYSGKCQICGTTFYQDNGKPFFISYYLFPRRISDAADTVGNSICLCANHFAQMIHGKRESLDVIEQLDRIDLNSKSFELTLTLDGIQCTIRYNQKHAIAFKAFYESHKKKNQKKFSTL